MFQKRVKSKTNAYGVARIVRHSYSTVNGFTKANSWWDLRKAVNTRDGGRCVPCRRLGRSVAATDCHHIVALSKGGTNSMGNLISVCDACHRARHNHMARAKPR